MILISTNKPKKSSAAKLKLPDFLKIFSDKDFIRRNLPIFDDEKWSVLFRLTRLDIRRYIMVKQDALMESLSSNLHGFLNQIQGDLSVPDKKFLRYRLLGDRTGWQYRKA